jgi:ABC-type spermidine/putrescine transport system permease subunit II
MKVIKPILISSLAIPGAIFLLFVMTGVAFLAIELFSTGSYSSEWAGLLYAAMAYTYIAALVSTIPTIVLGLPASLIARKYGFLTKKVILVVAPLLGALFLSIAGALFFKRVDMQVFLWFMLAGGLGGLVNGYVFLRACKASA